MRMLSLILMVCFAVGSASAALVTQYEFEGNADDSIGSNDGTFVNGASTVFDAGRGSQVLTLDGTDDYVNVGDQDSLNFGATNSFSISAWFKTSQDSTNIWLPIVEKRRWVADSGYGYYKEGYSFGIYQNKLYFGIEDATNHGTGISGNSIVNDGLWHRVSAVRDTAEDKVYLYLDGFSDANPVTDATAGSLATTAEFQIGKRKAAMPGVDYFYFDGQIDDVEIYNHAIPEPCTIALLSLGIVGLVRRR